MNMKIKKSIDLNIFAATLAALLGLLPGTSNATLMNAGESALFNFDFTSVLPATDLPFSSIMTNTLVSSVDLGDDFGLTYYNELNGVNQLVKFSFQNPGPTVPISLNLSGSAGLLDGIFSIAEFVDAGAVDFGPLTVTGYYSDPNTGGQVSYTLEGTPTTISVPEPPTIELFILGLAVLTYMPRRINTVTSLL